MTTHNYIGVCEEYPMLRKGAVKAEEGELFCLPFNMRDGIAIVCPATLDESPQAYKPMDEILHLIEPTAEVVAMVKPRINIKDIPK